MDSYIDDLYEFKDYRIFLKEHYRLKKDLNSSWSYGLWAKKMGLSGNSTLVKVINGQREVGPKLEKKFVEYFHFDSPQAQYFHLLLELSRNKNRPFQLRSVKKKLGKRYGFQERTPLEEESMNQLSHWTYFVLRQSFKIRHFKNNIEELEEALVIKVPRLRIAKVVNKLKDLRLVRNLQKDLKNQKPEFVASDDITTSDDVPSISIRQYHKSVLELGAQVIDQVPVNEREFSSLNFCLQEKDLQEARAIIREFEDSFSSRFEARGNTGDDVYQLNMQFFPVTQFKKDINK